MQYYVENWRKTTNDQNILNIVQNFQTEFFDGINPVNSNCYTDHFSGEESKITDQEISKLLAMGVIKEVQHDKNEYISPIFMVPKKNGEYRMILNLKELNKNIPYHHFKMETFESALKLVKPNCYVASIDIRHAYYSVPIAEESQVKLKFHRAGKIYQYCLTRT